MAETLGSLCDKLTIIKLKQYHCDEVQKKYSLNKQEIMLIEEIDSYLADLTKGNIPPEKITFDSNKIYKKTGNETREFSAELGDIISQLANINCELWHEQDKVYDFSNVPIDEKNIVVNNLAILNLERNKCIDEINNIIKRKFSK